MSKRTLVLGASLKPHRYSNQAIRALRDHQHDVIAVGLRSGEVEDVTIDTEFPEDSNIHTVTIYLGMERQMVYTDYLLMLKPTRVIFNPGAENPELAHRLQQNGTETLEACTLVMLATQQY